MELGIIKSHCLEAPECRKKSSLAVERVQVLEKSLMPGRIKHKQSFFALSGLIFRYKISTSLDSRSLQLLAILGNLRRDSKLRDSDA